MAKKKRDLTKAIIEKVKKDIKKDELKTLKYLKTIKATVEYNKKGTHLLLNMLQDIDTNDKEVGVVTFVSGDQALLIDGEIYHMEVMFYKSKGDGSKKETNHTVRELDMSIVDYVKAEISI